MDTYNYTKFEMSDEETNHFERFYEAPNAGTVAPDFALENLATGDTIQLQDLWKGDAVIMEFGSYS